MFERDKLWRHVNNKTVAMEVLGQLRKVDRFYRLIVKWWNVGGCHDPYPMNVTQCVDIPDDKLGEWLGMDKVKGRVPNPNYNSKQDWPPCTK